jgi:hypothetical protein
VATLFAIVFVLVLLRLLSRIDRPERWFAYRLNGAYAILTNFE